MKRFFKKIFSRFPIVALTIILLFLASVAFTFALFDGVNALLFALFPAVEEWFGLFRGVLYAIVMTVTVLHVVNRDMTTEAKLPWLICVMALGVFGVMIYVVFSYNVPTPAQKKRFLKMQAGLKEAVAFNYESQPVDMGRWTDESQALVGYDFTAIAHGNTKTQYFPSGEYFFEAFKEDLRRAEKYIFMEYFILERGKMWDEILAILQEKVNSGVDVRILYDDVGCMGRVGVGYARYLRKMGIECYRFAPFVPVVSNFHNNRDHRKITVIDGKIGYTGGINLADEYINEVQPFGVWKDSAIRLEGVGVKNLLLSFLQTYGLVTRKKDDFKALLPEEYPTFEGEGVVQPYCDGPRPMYRDTIGENVYLDLINGAKESVYITTPYLIIDSRIKDALTRAAMRGVDVRIITPSIPDKKIVFALTRSNYLHLIRYGVKIYEYTPGFIHAKNFLIDGEVGVVGTVNLDYRSLLHHYENAVLMYRTQAIQGLKEDFENTFPQCDLQTEESAKRGVIPRVFCEVAKVFAPMF